MRSGGFGPASRSSVIYHHKVGRSERTNPSPAPRLRRPSRLINPAVQFAAAAGAPARRRRGQRALSQRPRGRYRSKCVSRCSPDGSTSLKAFLHFAHDHRCATCGTRVLAGTSCTSVDPHAGHFLSVLMGIPSGMFTSPSVHTGPRGVGERGGTCTPLYPLVSPPTIPSTQFV